MTGWSEYALALALFVGSHFLPRVGGLRDRLIAAVGRRVYFSVYGLLSLALLVWVISAAGRAPYVELWPQMPWTRWVPNLAMPVAMVLAAIGAGLGQPYTLGGRRNAVFDPSDPGLAALSRHPLFLALALWAIAHLFPNGDLAHVILFGAFGLLALAAIPPSTPGRGARWNRRRRGTSSPRRRFCPLPRSSTGHGARRTPARWLRGRASAWRSGSGSTCSTCR